MKRTILAALAFGTVSMAASAQTVDTTTQATPGAPPAATEAERHRAVIYDATLAEKFAIKRDIVEQVQQIWGETAAYETGQQLPDYINTQIVPGQPMPADAPIEPVPAALDDLPKLIQDSRWVKSGTHLVELTGDDQIVMVVYNVLP